MELHDLSTAYYALNILFMDGALVGLDTCRAIMEVLYTGLGDDKYRPCPLLRKMVTAGLLGKKSGRGFYEYS